jgi:hypothetical protein
VRARALVILGVAGFAAIGAGSLWAIGRGGDVVLLSRGAAPALGPAVQAPADTWLSPTPNAPWTWPVASGGVAPATALLRPAIPARTFGASPLPGSAPEVDWEEVPLAVRVARLGHAARPTKEGLDTARSALSRCAKADAARGAREAAADGAASNPGDPGGEHGPASLVLHLEAGDGEVRVTEVVVDRLGDASPELVRCSVGVLRGARWPAEALVLEPVSRYRLQFTLLP